MSTWIDNILFDKVINLLAIGAAVLLLGTPAVGAILGTALGTASPAGVVPAAGFVVLGVVDTAALGATLKNPGWPVYF